MTDGIVRDQIGRELRAVYESIPKGGIPDRIWRLLLSMEQVELRQKARPKTARA